MSKHSGEQITLRQHRSTVVFLLCKSMSGIAYIGYLGTFADMQSTRSRQPESDVILNVHAVACL